jgi:hypothetical protein
MCPRAKIATLPMLQPQTRRQPGQLATRPPTSPSTTSTATTRARPSPQRLWSRRPWLQTAPPRLSRPPRPRRPRLCRGRRLGLAFRADERRGRGTRHHDH